MNIHRINNQQQPSFRANLNLHENSIKLPADVMEGFEAAKRRYEEFPQGDYSFLYQLLHGVPFIALVKMSGKTELKNIGRTASNLNREKTEAFLLRNYNRLNRAE